MGIISAASVSVLAYKVDCTGTYLTRSSSLYTNLRGLYGIIIVSIRIVFVFLLPNVPTRPSSVGFPGSF